MSELAQAEADYLISLEKRPVTGRSFGLPSLGGLLRIDLKARESAEDFILDIQRGRIELGRGKFQTRVRTTIPLVRLDFGGAPHRNPDGLELACPHLHIFREGFADKWAVALPPNFRNGADVSVLLPDFLSYCHILEIEFDRKDLFS